MSKRSRACSATFERTFFTFFFLSFLFVLLAWRWDDRCLISGSYPYADISWPSTGIVLRTRLKRQLLKRNINAYFAYLMLRGICKVYLNWVLLLVIAVFSSIRHGVHNFEIPTWRFNSGAKWLMNSWAALSCMHKVISIQELHVGLLIHLKGRSGWRSGLIRSDWQRKADWDCRPSLERR
jgi:hypothetical protein